MTLQCNSFIGKKSYFTAMNTVNRTRRVTTHTNTINLMTNKINNYTFCYCAVKFVHYIGVDVTRFAN